MNSNSDRPHTLLEVQRDLDMVAGEARVVMEEITVHSARNQEEPMYAALRRYADLNRRREQLQAKQRELNDAKERA